MTVRTAIMGATNGISIAATIPDLTVRERDHADHLVDESISVCGAGGTGGSMAPLALPSGWTVRCPGPQDPYLWN